MKMLENKVIYQIYPKSFKDTTGNGIGDIQGIIQKLDYIKDLGVDYIWLSPCCKSPQNDNGYDIADYVSIDPLFGSNDDYTQFIKEANQRGMKVMMDLVLNHTSSEHEWFQKALQKDEKYYDYYIWRDEPNDLRSYFDTSAWTYNEQIGKYYFHLFDKSQPDLNWQNPNVREDIYKIVNYWIAQGVEGFRLDVIDLIGKEPDKFITSKGELFYTYLEELNAQTFKDKILTVGECWGSNLQEQKRMCNDNGLTQAFHFTHFGLNHNGDKWHRHSLNVEDVASCFDTWQNTYDGIDAVVMNNHDSPRLISTWFNDQMYRKESAKLAITVFGLLHGNLYIYQGEEIGMRNVWWKDLDKYNDVETKNVYIRLQEEGYTHTQIMEKIAFTSRDNGRIPMQWDASENAGFTSGTPWLGIDEEFATINVEVDMQSDDSVYRYYQKLLAFRKEQYDTLKQKAVFSSHDGVYMMAKGNLHVIANFSVEEKTKQIKGKVLFTNYATQSDVLRAYEVIVYEV